MGKRVFEKIQEILDESEVSYRVIIHQAVFTSGEAAKARGLGAGGMRLGAKAMIVQVDGVFAQCVIPADKMLDLKKLERFAGAQIVCLAKQADVVKVTDCEPGSVPPFGSLWGIKVYADPTLADVLYFNAGLHEKSITMLRRDWENVVKPVMVDLVQESTMSQKKK